MIWIAQLTIALAAIVGLGMFVSVIFQEQGRKLRTERILRSLGPTTTPGEWLSALKDVWFPPNNFRLASKEQTLARLGRNNRTLTKYKENHPAEPNGNLVNYILELGHGMERLALEDAQESVAYETLRMIAHVNVHALLRVHGSQMRNKKHRENAVPAGVRDIE